MKQAVSRTDYALLMVLIAGKGTINQISFACHLLSVALAGYDYLSVSYRVNVQGILRVKLAGPKKPVFFDLRIRVSLAGKQADPFSQELLCKQNFIVGIVGNW